MTRTRLGYVDCGPVRPSLIAERIINDLGVKESGAVRFATTKWDKDSDSFYIEEYSFVVKKGLPYDVSRM